IARDGASTPENVRAAAAPVLLGLADEPDFPHRGTIDFIDNQIDPSTGTIHVRAVLPNPDRLLAPGLFVRVRVPVGEARPGLLVPDGATGAAEAGKYARAATGRTAVEYRP